MNPEKEEIVWIPIEQVTPFDKNRNQHSKEQVERLAKLIKHHGWRHPLIISKGPAYPGVMAAGHCRLLAAKELGCEVVPVHYQEFESTEAFETFSISDNAISAWAELDLAGINLDIGAFGPDFDLELLGLKDFTIDVTDYFTEPDLKGDPNLRDFETNKCPNCGVLIPRG